jgi:hypothetical protein
MICGVNARTKKILEEVLELPRDERAAIAHDVLASLGDEAGDASAAWGDVIRRRADDVLAGRDHGPECRPFLADLRVRLRNGE